MYSIRLNEEILMHLQAWVWGI